jgi:hypothetical protein
VNLAKVSRLLAMLSMHGLFRFAALALLLPLAACASHDAALAPPQDLRPTAIVAEHERQLTRALVVRNHAGVNHLLAPDFTCSVTGRFPFSLDSRAARYTACAGMGHDPSRRPAPPEPMDRLLDRGPRVAEIKSMDVTEDGPAIVVVSTQVYQHWVPYDGAFERRSRLTDTWLQVHGAWQLVRRISEPLPGEDSGSRS